MNSSERALIEPDPRPTPPQSDLAAHLGHPAGVSARRLAGRLGTALWEAFPGHVALLDRDGVVVSVNNAWRRFGLANGGSATTGLGTNYLELCARAATGGEPEAAEAGDIVRAALAGVDPGRRLSYACGSRDERWFSLQAFPIPGRYSGALVVHSDVTDEQQRERQWQHRALHDPLTGLPNRRLLSDRLEHAVAGANRNPNSLALLFIELDGLQSIKERYGHDASDQVICEASRRLAAGVCPADTVGRWGGTEFLVIAEQLDDESAAHELAGRLAAGLAEPMQVGSDPVAMEPLIGVACLEQHQTVHHLLRAASQAVGGRRATRERQPSRNAAFIGRRAMKSGRRSADT